MAKGIPGKPAPDPISRKRPAYIFLLSRRFLSSITLRIKSESTICLSIASWTVTILVRFTTLFFSITRSRCFNNIAAWAVVSFMSYEESSSSSTAIFSSVHACIATPHTSKTFDTESFVLLPPLILSLLSSHKLTEINPCTIYLT